MEKITSEAAAKVKAWFDSAEVKAALEATEKATEGDTGTFEVVITTENLDRYQEVISIDGWELEHYRANPVVLWGHDHFTLPIGVANDIRIESGKMIAKGKFAPHAHAQEIRALYDMGIVRATSVGFIEKERQGNLITKAELLEFSFVSVPANPYALSLAMQKELNINELVTKGILTLKNTSETETEETTKEDVSEEETPAAIASVDLTDEQKALVAETVKATLTALNVRALEDTEAGDPERTDDEQEDDADPEQKAMERFTATKKLLQAVDTTFGEVLAELRQAHSRR